MSGSPSTTTPAAAPTPSAPVKGIIYPPLDIRTVADKTARFVAKSGDRFQDRLRETNRTNPKFSFLTPSDPYHAYYQLKVREAREHPDGEAPSHSHGGGERTDGHLQHQINDLQKEIDHQDAPTEAAAAAVAPERPPPFEFTHSLPAITAQDLDVIRLTAQFVARNGRQFMTTLLQREQKNYQFAFLRPAHSLFNYFSKLVDQYTLILSPGGSEDAADLRNIVKRYAETPFHVLERVMARVAYESYVQEAKEREAEQNRQERLAFAAIDWHDFTVVGTIEFSGGVENIDDLPPPIRLADLQGMSMAQKSMAKEAAQLMTQAANSSNPSAGIAADTADGDMSDDMDIEMESEDDDDMAGSTVPEPAAVVVAPVKPMKIRTDYVPKTRAGVSVAEPTQLCPRCHQAIPVSEMDEHVRVELLDPKWKEQKEAALAKHKESNLVGADTDVISLLKNISGHRPQQQQPPPPTREGNSSLQATTAGQVGASGSDRASVRPEPVVWDGYSGSAAITNQRAQEAAQRAPRPAESSAAQIGPQVGSKPDTRSGGKDGSAPVAKKPRV
ncbi:SF3a splicing factor complex subunit [Tieghemiomyces parasiticus]|uniref:SF3a splicing factor complex subunit n=1 Tax=Tieghemiomyces parasiticus TaxID=78921 RepID=A0A9W8E0S4_9FUNG|nr:SF3a splicing factor complex subunit [Tieghemiomyces parasiticus]